MLSRLLFLGPVGGAEVDRQLPDEQQADCCGAGAEAFFEESFPQILSV